MTDNNGSPLEASDKKPRHRSPNYPTVGLRDAVERLRLFYKKNLKAGAPPELAAQHIGFNKAHGQAFSTLAALKKFGLVQEANGRIVPTQRGVEIVILQPTDPRRIKALQEAAISPDIYRELIEQHKETGFPADDVLQAELVAYKNFNPNSVEGFVRDFRDTLEFAGLSSTEALDLTQEDDQEQMLSKDQELERNTAGTVFSAEINRGKTPAEAMATVADRMRGALLNQKLVISIPRNFAVDISIKGDELRREDLAKIKNQFNRWIEGLEEAFD